MKKRVLLFLILIFLNSVIYIVLINGKTITGESITGKASTQQTNISIYISVPPPNLSIISPKNNTYLTNSILLNYSSSYANNLWYNLDNSMNITINSPIYFNVGEGSHVLYLYANNTDGVIILKNISFSVNLTKFIIYYEEYKGAYKGDSTDFYQYSYEEIQNLSGVILENTNFGKILFKGPVNLTDNINFTDNILDLDSYTNISSNRIELDSNNLFNFNRSSVLWIYNLSYLNPLILRDEVLCPSYLCIKENYFGGILKFNISSFTVYSSKEMTIEEIPLLRTGIGGGLGREIKKENESFLGLEVEIIRKKLKVGDILVANISILNNYNKTIDVFFSYGISDLNSKVISFKEENLRIEKKLYNFLIELNVPELIAPGNYTFFSQIFYDNKSTIKIKDFVIESAEKPEKPEKEELNETLKKIKFKESSYYLILVVLLIALVIWLLIIIYWIMRKVNYDFLLRRFRKIKPQKIRKSIRNTKSLN